MFQSLIPICAKPSVRLFSMFFEIISGVLQELEPHLTEVPFDDVVRVRENRLCRLLQLKDRPLHLDYHRHGPIPEQRLSDEGVEVGLGGAAERDSGYLGAHDEDPGRLVLDEVFDEVEDNIASEAALLVHHEASD
ncbi:hypothetical protein Fmac_024465 [Flemingia macrophylla]|uniref:Uncharacterized protein n=1 Tax=Flemingia macrophylla TaxID=520843 RepID=A0ABD1LPF9_9FABA